MTALQCKTACTDTVNDLNGCADIDCLCTNDNGKQLKKCVDCLVGVGGSDVTSSGQSTLDSEFLNFIWVPGNM